MVVAVLSSFNTSLFWFRVDMMRSFLDAGYAVLAVGDGAEEEWAPKFAELGIRYRSIPVQRNGTNPVKDLDTLRGQKVFFQNRDDLKVFVDHGIVREEKAVMLHGSGVNIEKFSPAPLPEKPGFLCISRLIRDKGVREYLDAARKLHALRPEVSCVLVGPFDTNPSAIKPEELQPYIDDGSVTYVGEQKDVQPWLKQCTAYVLPSYHEGTPKTVLEAMACSRPTITTDAPGCRETVADGVNGYLVPVKDVDAIVEAMEKMLDDPEKIAAMAAQARRICEDRYDVRKVNRTIRQTMGIE